MIPTTPKQPHPWDRPQPPSPTRLDPNRPPSPTGGPTRDIRFIIYDADGNRLATAIAIIPAGVQHIVVDAESTGDPIEWYQAASRGEERP